MGTPAGDDEGQSQQQPSGDSTRNFNIAGPYEQLLTRVFDEAVKVLPVLAIWVVSLAILIAPKNQKDMIRGLKTEMDMVDGNFAKLFWSISAPAIAIRCHFMRKSDKKDEKEEQEQEA
jgi:hypothetical protein